MFRNALWSPVLVLVLVTALSCNGDKGNDEVPTSPSAVETGTAAPESASGEEESREASSAGTSESSIDPTLPNVSAASGLLYVYFFDVSLGDAIYIRTPTGEDVIIDGGDSRAELSRFLDGLGETAIDVVIASHPHADHIGGLPKVLAERPVASVWTNGQNHTTNLFRDLDTAITNSGAERNVGTPGATFSLGGVLFTVLAPVRIGSNINDNSLVVRMDCGESSFLFAGDAETSSESEMILLGRNLDVDVLKLGHHGSRTSTSSQMVLATSPRLAIYQARADNQFGHPHQETLDRLAAANVPTFGTKAAGGTVVVATACDDQFSVSPQFANFPLVPAAPSGPAPTAVAVATVPLPTQPPASTATQQPASTAVQATQPAQANCHPSYQGGTDKDSGGCIRSGIGDYDCWPGTGDGPNYAIGPVTVLGTDSFGLDTNDPDNIGCES